LTLLTTKNSLTQAEQRELASRMEKKQMRSFIDVIRPAVSLPLQY
jgi:hypothetical protein